MYSVATMTEYNEQMKQLDEVAIIFPDISWWVIWWDGTKYHKFSAFGHFGNINVTLAESGNVMLKCHTKLWLLEAAWDDITTMLTQIDKFHLFLAEVTPSSSKGSCYLAHYRANWSTQICTAKAYTAEFSNMHAQCEAIEKSTNPQAFVPSSSARCRPVKIKTGVEGAFFIKRNQRQEWWM